MEGYELQPIEGMPGTVTPIRFRLGGGVAFQLYTHLGAALTGNAMRFGNSAEGVEDAYTNFLVPFMWNATTDPQAWIDGLAASITDFLRNLNPASRPEFDGTAYELGITVRWVWLCFPIALVTLSGTILVASIVSTQRSRVAPWKGSFLNLLLLDLDDPLKEECHGQMTRYQGPEAAIARSKVRLLEQHGRLWKLKAA